jgi:hypothetical protein
MERGADAKDKTPKELMMTPIPSGVAHPLIDGLKNEVICRDERIDEFVQIEKTSSKMR